MTWESAREERYMNSKKGQTIVEAAVAIAIASLVITALVGLGIGALRSATVSKNRSLATSYAQEAVEAIRSIRDRNFSDFVTCSDGTPYRLIRSGSQWGCQKDSGAETLDSIFTRSFTSSEEPPLDSGQFHVQVNVTWTDSAGNHTVTLDTYLTNWR